MLCHIYKKFLNVGEFFSRFFLCECFSPFTDEFQRFGGFVSVQRMEIAVTQPVLGGIRGKRKANECLEAQASHTSASRLP
jgi:hypothetical protein